MHVLLVATPSPAVIIWYLNLDTLAPKKYYISSWKLLRVGNKRDSQRTGLRLCPTITFYPKARKHTTLRAKVIAPGMPEPPVL